ncbi:MAG TPA: VOC family protein [Chitinophagales bacterium]|nr:VOC family protein [Chitinophagales bacterium]HNI54845.1 VOC family protein [Chitinophagales bacterium]
MQGLRTCIYKVTDLEAGKAWYSKAFNQTPYFDHPFYVGFDIGGFELGLLPEEEEKHVYGNNMLVYWGVDDIQSSYDHLVSVGATSHEAPHAVGDDIMVATVFDPWGNIVGIIYNPGFKMV